MKPVRRNIQKQLEARWISPAEQKAWNAIYDFVETGDRAVLKGASGVRPWGIDDLFADVTPPWALDQDAQRLVHALIAVGAESTVVSWFLDQAVHAPANVATHALLREQLAAAKGSTTQLLEWTVRRARLTGADGTPTDAGRWVLTHSADEIEAEDSRSKSLRANWELLELYRRSARDRLPKFVPRALQQGGSDAVIQLLRHEPEVFEPYVIEYLSNAPDLGVRMASFRALFERLGDRYRGAAIEAAAEWMARCPSDYIRGTEPIDWLIDHAPERVVPALTASVGTFREVEEVLDRVTHRFGASARPVLVTWVKHRNPETALAALRSLLAIDAVPDEPLLRDALAFAFARPYAGNVVPFVELIGSEPKLGCCADMLWDALQSSSQPLKRAASRALALRGEASVPRAVELLNATSAGTRIAAANVLIGIGTPDALDAVDRHLDTERQAAAADEMLTALVQQRCRRGGTFSRADVVRAIARDAARLAEPPRPWVDRAALPPLVDAEGTPLAADQVAYLLFRQSGCKEMVQDVVARPIYEQIDRKRSGDFAFELLRQFLQSPQEAKDRWALVVACRLGDERVVPLLTRQIHEWADEGRGKLAEWAVEALTLQGSDLALLSVDGIAMRYRSKNVNVGRAASAALDRAADELGVSRDELGDRIIPWLMFEPGKPKVYDADGRRLELRIGTDFKPRLVDVAKRKELGAMPKAAGADAAAEFALLKKLLRDVAKNQTLRLESLLIRQRRWPVARWKELFLQHPLLQPFAVGLVWGVYRGAGPAATFRSLGDGTLTDAADEPFELPADGDIGIVHPLDLDAAPVAQWTAHLADHEIEPPFPQLARKVVRVADAERASRVYTAVNGTKLNGMTFKGRATRLGWRVGSVLDAGSVESYYVEFPAAGVTAYLMLDDMNVSVDREWDVTIRDLYFTKDMDGEPGYAYAGEPRNADDPSVLAFGDVAPIVFSEVMAALAAITGKDAADGGDAQGEATGDDA